MSASRLVMARTWGFPLTLLKSTTGPPSRCFCTPVISRSGSTSTSVFITSPCVSNHSSAERSDVTSFLTSFFVSSANAVAIISLLLFYVEQTVSLFLNQPQASQLASHALRERAFLRQFFILTPRQTQPLDEHFFVVRSQTRRRTADAARCLTQFVGNHPVLMISQLRVFLLLPDVPESDLRICKEVLHAINFRCVYAASLQPPHQPFRRLASSPGANQPIEFVLVFFSLLKRGKALIRQPFGGICRATETLPFLIVPTANHAPFTVVAWVTSVRRGRCVAIAVAVCNDAVCRIIKHRAADELHASFKLRKIDVRTL